MAGLSLLNVVEGINSHVRIENIAGLLLLPHSAITTQVNWHTTWVIKCSNKIENVSPPNILCTSNR